MSLTYKRVTEHVYRMREVIHGFTQTLTTDWYYAQDPDGRWWRSERLEEILGIPNGNYPMVKMPAGLEDMPSMVCRPACDRAQGLFDKHFAQLAVGEEQPYKTD